MARTAAVVLTLAAILILAGCGADPAFTSGKVYLQQEDFDSAIEQFQIAIRNNASDWQPHMWLGRAYAETEELEMAHDEFFTALDLAVDPAAKEEVEQTITYYWQIYQQEGNLQNSAGNFQGAIAEFDKAIVIDPRKADAYMRARRLRELLAAVDPLDDDSCIPETSLLREFIGGGIYGQ